MKLQDLQEKDKYYTIYMSNKQEFYVIGTQKLAILQAQSQFIEVDGELINKAFIVSIRLDKDRTKENYLKSLPEKA